MSCLFEVPLFCCITLLDVYAVIKSLEVEEACLIEERKLVHTLIARQLHDGSLSWRSCTGGSLSGGASSRSQCQTSRRRL